MGVIMPSNIKISHRLAKRRRRERLDEQRVAYLRGLFEDCRRFLAETPRAQSSPESV